MKQTPLPRIISLASIVSLFATSSLMAVTVSWDGGANPPGTSALPNWGEAANWSSDALPGANDDVVIAVNTGLNGNRRLNVNMSATVQSITGSVANLMIRASGGPQTLTVGGDDTGNASFITLNLNRNVSDITFTGTSDNNTLYVEFGHHLTLTHSGTGETAFGNSKLRNTSTSTGTDTIAFAGGGDWAFLAQGASSSSAIEKNSANAILNVELQSGANAFTGVLRYASTNAMNVDNLQVNSGTLLLDNARIITSGTDTTTGLLVGSAGTLAGSGTIFGSATVDGTLSLGGGTNGNYGVLTFKNGLTFQSSAQTHMQIGGLTPAEHDAVIVDGGRITYAGELIVTLTGSYNIGDSWVLFSGFDSVEGFFNSIALNGQSLSRSGDIWTRTIDGVAFQFNQQDGTLSIVIPEPSSASLMVLVVTGALAFCFRSRLRRR